MAEPVLRALVAEARSLHGDDVAAIVVHATGDLVPGQVAVAIHTASTHRAAAFAACRHLIERIKEDLPIWKRESYADGTSEWLKGS